MRIIATNKPIPHGSIKVQKSLESLNKLLSLDSLPLVDEHTDKVLGKVSGFMLRVRNGITEVLADIPSQFLSRNKGFSLQFSGVLADGVIDINEFKHLALTANPRDTLTFSESSDTDATITENVETQPTDQLTELDSDKLAEMLELPEIKERLLKLLGVTIEEQPESTNPADQTVEPVDNSVDIQATDQIPAGSEKSEEAGETNGKETKVETIRVVVKPRVIAPQQKPERATLKRTNLPFPSL